MTTGGIILIGQCFGGGNQERQKRATGTLVTMSMALGLFSAAAALRGGGAYFEGFRGPQPGEAKAYLQTCAIGMVFVFGYNALSSVLRAVGNSRQPFYFIIAATAVSVVLDLLLMGYYRLGTMGAAAAAYHRPGGILYFGLAPHLLRRSELFR